MPTTRFERLIAATALVVAAVLAVLTFTAWREYRDDRPPAAAAVTELATAPDVEVAATTVARPVPPAPPPTVKVAIRAVRGASWLAVREGSATGNRLFEGILPRGHRRSFESERLWMRLGLPDYLVATVNGRPTKLPPGTANVIVDGDGLRVVELG